ncbi:MAG: hypothetical protein ACHQFX_00170 [Chitinophagales bacterium]
MKKYRSLMRLWPAAISFLFLCHSGNVYGQWKYLASKAQYIAGTYTDLGTSGVAIISNFAGGAMTFDNANSSVQNIGFNFYYNGSAFSQFVLNSNGFIKLGNTAPATNNFDVLSSADINTIAPFNYDLRAGTLTPEYRVFTSGSPGSRICTIQFENLRDVATSQYNNINFQVKLYETSNMIEFVYGSFTANGAAAFKEMIVGIKGSDSTYSVNATKSSADPWNTTTFINGVYPAPNTKFNNRNNVLPLSGATFRFNTAVFDAKVEAVYTLYQLPIPAANPHVVRARIRNTGETILSNLPVTLTVTGGNLFTNIQLVTVLPHESILISFDSFSPSKLGLNFVAVSVPDDDTTMNNSSYKSQWANENTYSYGYSSPTGNLGWGNSAGLFLAKYSVSGTDTVAMVRVHINEAANVGNTIYAVVMDATGNIIAQSDPHVTQSDDLGMYKEFIINNSPGLRNTDFYVGLAQTANSETAYYPLSTQTESAPTSPGTYFYSLGLGGGIPTETVDFGKFMIEAVLNTTSLTLNEFNYRAADAQNSSGVYTDLALSGSAITLNYTGSPITYDNDNSSVQNIGFDFFYNGTIYTQFILNSNGFIKLGNTPGAASNFDVLASVDNNIIAPFNYDLNAGTGIPEYRAFTTGSPGSRVCTIQFKNLRDKSSSQYNNINFQIKLYETSTNIEFVYGSFTSSGASAVTIPAIVSLKGAPLAYPVYSVSGTKGAATPWSSATFIDGLYVSNKFDTRNNVLPISGTTLRFRSVKDLKVDAVYTFSKVPNPIGVYNHIVSAKIRNTGSVNLINYPITLNITGANTATKIKSIEALSPKDSIIVEFDPVSLWNSGTNTVMVSVPSDDVNTNNNATYQQEVNDSIYSYADGSSPTGAAGFNTGEGIVFTRYRISSGGVLVTGVRVYISNDINNIGQLVSGVAWNGSDNIYIFSDSSVILVSDTAKYKTFKFNTPLLVEGGSIYVGLKQEINVLGFNPVGYQKEGPPARPEVFYKDAPPYGSLNDFTSGRLMIEAIVKPATVIPPTFSEESLAEWRFADYESPASVPADYFHRNLISSNLLTRGPGALASSGNGVFVTAGFGNNGISTANTDYFQFVIGANQRDTLSLSSISIGDFFLDSSYFFPNGVYTQLAYSLNGVNFTLIGSPVQVMYEWESYTLDLSSISELQNILNGTSVTFRFYATGNNTSGVFGFKPRYAEPASIAVNGIIKRDAIMAGSVVGADFYLPNCNSTASGLISFNSTGTYAPGNVYVAKINTTLWARDTSAIIIGTLASTANSGTINFTIPAGIDKRLWGHHEGYIDIWIESTSNPWAKSIRSPEFRLTAGEQCYGPFVNFRSKQSGNWNSVSTWEMSTDTNWIASTFIPDHRAGNVRIRSVDSVTVTTPVNIRSAVVSGKLSVLNGGANNGSLTFYLKEIGGFLHDGYQYCMRIDSGAVLHVVSQSAMFDNVIRANPIYPRQEKRLMEVLGKIKIGDGTSSNGPGFHKFATHPIKKFRFFDESIFEWNSTGVNGPVSNFEYFRLAWGHPVLRFTKMPPGNFGGPENTIINATMEINTPVTMAGQGVKEFRDGLSGSSVLTQAPGSGEFITVSPYTEIPPTDTSGATIGILRGNLTVNLSNGGLILKNGARVINNANIVITGSGISKGKIEVEPSAKMTLDPSAVLIIENADLLNDGIIDGAGKIQFTGPDTSQLRSPGTINAKLELSTKQLRLISHSTASSIDLLGGSHLRLDSFHLNMRTGNLAADSTNFIVTNDTGRLSRYVPSDPLVEVPFHIGISEASYTPVSITNSGVGDDFSVRVKAGVFDSINNPITSGNVNRTWLVTDATEGGSNVKLKMQWNIADQQPGFDLNSTRVSQGSLCPPPINCSGSYFDYSPLVAATNVALGIYSVERSGIDSFNTNSFIVTSNPFVYTFDGNGDWNNVNNWSPGIIPPAIIPAGVEVIINHSSAPNSECVHTGNIIVATGGKLTILPGKKLRIEHN